VVHQPAPSSRHWRPLAWALVVLLALVLGTVGAFLHAGTVEVLGISLPVGLVLGLVSGAGLIALARQISTSRWGVLVAFLAWFAPVVVLSQQTAAGDIVLAADAYGLLYLAGVTLVGAVGLGLPLASKGAPSAPSVRAGADVDALSTG
jgi:hypothetical protein